MRALDGGSCTTCALGGNSMFVLAETDVDVSWGVSDGAMADRFGAASQPIAASRCSCAPTDLPLEASWVATRMASANWANFKYSEPPLPRTCRSELVRDLARSGSKVSECGVSDGTMANGFGAASQPIAAVVTSGHSYRYGVVAGSDVAAHADCFCPEGVGARLVPRSAAPRQQGRRMRWVWGTDGGWCWGCCAVHRGLAVLVRSYRPAARSRVG
jgi:hypothetical protein